ncbi:hypothetical protein [Microbacterium memoriense]|uniref:Uncharacterized protein n=1 Tax=Microbacterium memoriense TaxID=2978350 RepID=A0ABT2PFZ5_9MICO|nr:hypothetical protein [Microbacterium memoriense]MCT9002669.1 hypothetical protein [Microbacterium memoriense]
MDPHDEDTSLSAMRSLDPAAGTEAPAHLRSHVTGIPDNAARSSVHAGRSRWLAPAAAAAALVVGLGGGYLAGSRGDAAPSAAATATPSGTPITVAVGSAEEPAPPVSLGGAGRSGAGDAGLLGGQEATANSATADAAVSPWHYSNGRRFIVPPFDQTPSMSAVYALDGRAQYSAPDAERIAAALGLDGTAHQDQPEQGWIVGDRQGNGPRLWLSPTGAGDVNFSGGIADPHSECWAAIGPKYGVDTGTDMTEDDWKAFDAETKQCLADTPMPTEQQARDALSLFLSATGVDELQTQVTVTPEEQGRTISASAARVVAENATVVTSTITVSAKGFLYGYGPTATIVSLGNYDIVSPAEAAARLNDPVFAPAYASTMASEVDYEQFDDPATEPPAVPAAGALVPWGITEFEIVSARLGLAQMTSIDDERFLAPAYEFTDTEGNVWSVLALAEREIDPVGGGASYGWGGFVY